MKHHATSLADGAAGDLERVVQRISDRRPLAADASAASLVRRSTDSGAPMYSNVNDRLGIDFRVERLAFPDIQCMDPRVVRIAAGRCNEYHRHAHESIFVVMEGRGAVAIGSEEIAVAAGDIVYVPRWAFHQTRNTEAAGDLVILAITDFGLTSAVLGDYDRRTRLRESGDQAGAPGQEEV
jgi:mannose-6-phosphate isomerase-like protein (cupin superfamily)